MSEWPVVTVGDVAIRVTKGTTPTLAAGGFTDSGIAFVKVESIMKDGTIDSSRLAFIAPATHEALGRSMLKTDDILFSIAGSIGRVARVSAELVPANTNQALAIVRPNRSVVDAGYLLYGLRDKDRLDDALSKVVQSVQANLSLAQLSAIELPLPPMAEQRAIAEVLGALDDKIAANTNLIQRADFLSQAVFRSLQGGSEPISLSATARFVNGRAFTKGASGTGRVVVRIAELHSGIGGSTVYSDAEVDEDYRAQAGDILFAWSGSLTLHRWFRAEAIVNQHIFKVIPNGYPSWVIYELVRENLAYFKGIAADKATTMGHIQRRHLDEPVLVPSPSSIDSVDDLMTSLWDRSLLAERESESLAATRDTLLPQLMSGRLRVRDAEKVLSEVM